MCPLMGHLFMLRYIAVTPSGLRSTDAGFGGSEADAGVKAIAGPEAAEAVRTFFKERCPAA